MPYAALVAALAVTGAGEVLLLLLLLLPSAPPGLTPVSFAVPTVGAALAVATRLRGLAGRLPAAVTGVTAE